MARLIVAALALLLSQAAQAIAVEYDLDKPLGSPELWKYYRAPQFYIQHACGKERLNAIAERISRFMQDKTGQNSTVEGEAQLQIRLYANAAQYRRALRFSKYRDGHFNARLTLLTSHCDAGPVTLAEQLNLYWLADSHLRKWQRIFIAEILAYDSRNSLRAAFADAIKDKPAPLLQVLLSNQTPGRTERAALRQLALFLSEKKRLDEFLAMLLEPPSADDTGLEILERLFPGESATILDQLGQAANPNKTLRKGQSK